MRQQFTQVGPHQGIELIGGDEVAGAMLIAMGMNARELALTYVVGLAE
jgi:hypothetical protein